MKLRFSFLKKNKGSTLIETLAYLVILSLISGMLSFSLFVFIHSWQKSSIMASDYAQLLMLGKNIEKQLSRARFPFWLKEFPFSMQAGKLEIAYLDGEKDKSAAFLVEENKLYFLEKDIKSLVSGKLPVLGMALYYGDNKKSGLKINITINKQQRELYYAFPYQILQSY